MSHEAGTPFDPTQQQVHFVSDIATNPTPTAALHDGSAAASLTGYMVTQRIGLGGMGEIVLARDERIGRDVAIKRLRDANPSSEAAARFLREARIQAHLDHSSIAPVYELGRDDRGQPYFTMKRLTGTTLAEALGRFDTPIQRLLRAFIDVCLAVEFAHARGVVHRDLKPANIMLGDFGEVYVLDWGVARVMHRTETDEMSSIPSLDGDTGEGVILGTPGYMAPEQIESAIDVGPASDVYSLGTILFEILAREPVHPRGAGAVTSTLSAIDHSPARRRPDLGIPPELDGLTVDALAHDPRARPSARVVADTVQRYLDGDRDIARRQTLAAEELTNARAALVPGDPSKRSEAIRAAGRALALVPDSRDAADLVTSLMIHPPAEQPNELRAELEASDAAVQMRQARVAATALLVLLVFIVIAATNGTRDPFLVVAILAYGGTLAMAAWSVSRLRASTRQMWLVAIGNAVFAAVLSRMFGSLIIVPVITCVMAVSLTSYPQLIKHARVVLAILVASWLVPVVLEVAGVLASTWYVADQQIISASRIISSGGATTSAILVIGNLAAIVVIGMFANALATSRRDALRQVEIQAWHLRQLLPRTS